MDIGVIYPHAEVGSNGTEVRDFAQAAEALGYAHVLVFDHILGANAAGPDMAGRYHHRTPFHEPLVLLSYIAAVTSTIGLATGVVILPQRQTALVAKQAAELQILSGGRFRLGIGTGWNAVEYEALGQDFHTRGARQEEQVGLLRKLWKDELVTFAGRFDRVTDAGLNPRPSADIPIWFGGRSEVVLKRAARLGAGWFPQIRPGDELAATLERLHGYLREAGRDPSTFGIDGVLNYDDSGDVERWGRQLEAWRAAGASHVSVRTQPAMLAEPRPEAGLAYHIRALEQYREVFRGE